ncbi:MAG: chromate transporter [Hyphomicrobiales bacterium]
MGDGGGGGDRRLRPRALRRRRLAVHQGGVRHLGGAYAVLLYIANEAVNTYGWLAAGDMLNGLALAETSWTVGLGAALRRVLCRLEQQRGGAAAGNRRRGVDHAWTFLPSFLFIFAGAPYIERLHRMPSLASALGAINAAVVGVILNLAAYSCGAHIFSGRRRRQRLRLLALATLTLLLPFRPIGLHWIVAAGAGCGLARWLI